MGISSSLGSSALLPAGLGFRNLIINGAMQIAQRGTSTASITAGGYYTADRWGFYPNTMGTWTLSVENDGPTGSGFTKSTKMLCTTADASPAAADYVQLVQIFEGQNLQSIRKGTSSAKQLIASFWVKSNVTGTYIVMLVDNDNTRLCSASYLITASATWEYKTIVFPADATGALDNDNNGSMRIIFQQGAGSNYTSGTLQTTWGPTVTANRAVGQVNLASATNNYWQITGVQLEANLQPTPFEQRPIGVELALCHRYFQQYNASNTATSPPQFPHHIDLANRGEVALVYNEKRTNPTISLGGTIGNHILQVLTTGSAYPASAYGGTYVGTGTTASIMFTTNTGLPANTVCVYYIQSDAFINISAEL